MPDVSEGSALPDTPYLTIADVLRRLHISDTTARHLIKSGQLPAYKIAGRYRFDPADVQAFLNRSRVSVNA